jgi:hypothetical protein
MCSVSLKITHAEADLIDSDLLASVHQSDPCAGLLCEPDLRSKRLRVQDPIHRARRSTVLLETQ